MQLLRSGIRAREGGKGLGRSSGLKVGNLEVKDSQVGVGKKKERRNVEEKCEIFNEFTGGWALSSDSVGWSVVKEMELNTERQEEITEVSGLQSHPDPGRRCRPCKGSYCCVCPPTFLVPSGQSDYGRKGTHGFKLTRNTSSATATRFLPSW